MKNSTETVLWAGSIQRYHNRPTAQRQTVGEHTWRVMIIYTELYGAPHQQIYYTLLYHDVPEIVTGDLPFMTKRQFPDVKLALTKAEIDVEVQFGIDKFALTEIERQQIKTADLLEMLFFAVDDVRMGCEYSIDIIENIMEVLPNGTQIENYIRDKGYKAAIDRILNTREKQNAWADNR